jgi:ribonuclease P protein component
VSCVFPNSKRVRQSKDFEQAFRHKGLVNKWFIIYISDSKHDVARLGMVVSKRIIAKSVSRNLAKRLIREIFRYQSAYLPPLDFIVRIRRKLSNDSCAEARVALLDFMLSAKII